MRCSVGDVQVEDEELLELAMRADMPIGAMSSPHA